jgi:predicted transcriptional regulator
MTARSIGSAAGVGSHIRPSRPRTFQKVRRFSQHAGEYESRRWKRENMFPRSENNSRLAQLEAVMLSTKLPGRRRGLVGNIEMEVYRFLLRRRGRLTGRLDYAIDTIAKEIKRARSAVINALARLRDLKFLEWQRRTAPVEDPEPGGQYVQQISNAYFLTLPRKAAELVRRIMRRPTEEGRRAQEHKRFLDEWNALTPDEQLDQISDPGLRETLERMRARFEGASPPSGQNEAM